MTKFRLANPCQNKESKRKKYDKRDKRNANECTFHHTPLNWNVADPAKPLTSYSAQINCDITIWFEMVRARPCMTNTACNWCQKKEDKLNIMSFLWQCKLCMINHYSFQKKLPDLWVSFFLGRTVYMYVTS